MVQPNPSTQTLSPRLRSASRRQRLVRSGTALLTATALLAVGFWAGLVVSRTSAPTSEQNEPSLEVTVSQQTLGRTLGLNTSVTQVRVPVATNLTSGVVTWVSDQQEFGAGDLLYRVDQMPVVAVEGPTPFYRALSNGMAGSDVEQLNLMLVALGYLWASDDQYDQWTEAAVQQWHEDLGLDPTGSVPLGQLVAVPLLPTSLNLDREQLRPGAKLNGGEELVTRVQSTPEFILSLTPSQAASIPPGAKITVRLDDLAWDAVTAETRRDDETGQIELVLSAPGGGPVCGDECHSLPGDEQLFLPTEVVLVPEVSGPVVPVGALTVEPDGSAFVQVVTSSNNVEHRPVQILASDRGIVLVSGVEVGEKVALASQLVAGQLPNGQPQSGE